MNRVLVLLVLLTACSSSGIIDTEAIEGGPGQDIGVALGGITGQDTPFISGNDDALQLSIEVANNSNADITVKRIAISPQHGEGPYRIDPTSQAFDETIAEGEDHLFTLGIRGRQVRPAQMGDSAEVTLRVVVALSNGDSYFYSFAVPVRIGRSS